MVSDLDRVDSGTDRFDHAGTLMSENQRRRRSPLALDDVIVAVTNTAGSQANEHLAIFWIVELELPGRHSCPLLRRRQL